MGDEQHLTILGTIYTIMGALALLVAVAVFIAMSSEAAVFVDTRAMIDAMTADIRLVIVLVSLLGGLLNLIAGIGLLKRKTWAWGLVWVVACLGLLNLPIGMVIGIYALWVLTRPEVRQALGVDAHGSSLMKTVKVTAAVALVLIIASYPACHFTEPIVQAELSKLSPEERELRQFDMEYMRYGLAGVLAFLWGSMLALVAIISLIVERRRIRKRVINPQEFQST